jgi:hypothetical protein
MIDVTTQLRSSLEYLARAQRQLGKLSTDTADAALADDLDLVDYLVGNAVVLLRGLLPRDSVLDVAREKRRADAAEFMGQEEARER